MADSKPQRLKGLLSVTVLKANNLIKSDWIGENDCYTVVSIEPPPLQAKVKSADKKQQTETYQKTQIHDGSNPIFNEKFVFPVAEKLETLYIQLWDADCDKDDLLGYGALDLLDDDKGGQFNTDLNKEWLHSAVISLTTEKGGDGGTAEVVLHFIPETVAAYMGRKFDAAQADFKKKLTQQIVGKMTDVAADKIRGSVGIGV